jgi:hypothetical protein
MQRRAQGVADGFVRKHVPSVQEPLILVVIDEIANLTAYLTDRKLKERIRQALGQPAMSQDTNSICLRRSSPS